jgi:hypothetical protein
VCVLGNEGHVLSHRRGLDRRRRNSGELHVNARGGLAGDCPQQRGLAYAGRAGEQHGVPGLDHYVDVLLFRFDCEWPWSGRKGARHGCRWRSRRVGQQVEQSGGSGSPTRERANMPSMNHDVAISTTTSMTLPVPRMMG